MVSPGARGAPIIAFTVERKGRDSWFGIQQGKLTCTHHCSHQRCRGKRDFVQDAVLGPTITSTVNDPAFLSHLKQGFLNCQLPSMIHNEHAIQEGALLRVEAVEGVFRPQEIASRLKNVNGMGGWGWCTPRPKPVCTEEAKEAVWFTSHGDFWWNACMTSHSGKLCQDLSVWYD